MQLRTEIAIAAPCARVWEVLTDFGAYPEWNPFLTSVSGELRVGARLQVTFGFPEGRQFRFSPTLLKVDPAHELRWAGKLWIKGLFDGEHFFQCHDSGDGGTRFVHGEDFKGILLKFMGRTLTDTARGFVFMNQALKRRVESLR